MGLWNRLFGRELRAEVVTADDHLTRLMKGIEISPETAMEIPAVSACVSFISTCIAGLPVKLYRENRRQNSTEEIKEDALAAVIKGAVVPVITAFEAALNRGLLLPSERDWMYFTFDTTELLKGDILKRYQAYKTGLECNVLQIDEARYKEDLPPLGLNFIKLGLQDVLFDPKTKVIYTPNMNQSMVMSENKVSFGEKDSGKPVDNAADGGIMEERDYIQNPDTGKMEGSTGGGSSGSGGNSSGGGSQEGASGQSEKTVTNAAGQTVRIVDHIRLTGEQPNSITQRQNAKGGIDRNYYDANGRQVKQISNNDHGNPKLHPFGKHGEHAHDYVLDKNGIPRHSKPRELSDDERKDNGDML